jgi:hypothetical protein
MRFKKPACFLEHDCIRSSPDTKTVRHPSRAAGHTRMHRCLAVSMNGRINHWGVIRCCLHLGCVWLCGLIFVLPIGMISRGCLVETEVWANFCILFSIMCKAFFRPWGEEGLACLVAYEAQHFWEQAGELLVIVLSVWEKHDPVYEENRTQKPNKWSRTAFNAHQSTQQAHALPNHRPRRHTIGTQGTKTASQLKQQLKANPNSRRHASTYSLPRGRRVSCRTRPDLEEALSKRCRRQCTLRPRCPHSK